MRVRRLCRAGVRRCDLRVRRLIQHLAGDDPVRLQRRVTGLQIGLVGDELPGLAGQRRQHDTLDGGEVAGFELHAFAGTERRARHVPEQGLTDCHTGRCQAVAGANMSTTESGRPLSFFFRFCSCGPSPAQRPGPRRRTYAAFHACDHRSARRKHNMRLNLLTAARAAVAA